MQETNANFTKHTVFRAACKLANLPATSRQASKYRRGLGLAKNFRQKALWISNQEKMNKVFLKGR